MTISAKLVYESWLGNGSTTVFPYTMRILAPEDVTLYEFDVSTEVLIPIDTSAYEITGVGPTKPGGGNITYNPGTPIPSTTRLYLYRTSDYLQQTSIVNQAGFLPQVIETALDELTSQTQLLEFEGRRSLKFPVFEERLSILPSASNRAGRYLVFDSKGDVSTASGFIDGNLIDSLAQIETIGAQYMGATLIWESDDTATWTLASNVPKGQEFCAVSMGLGPIKFVPEADGTIETPFDLPPSVIYNGTSLQRAMVHLFVRSNTLGNNARWVINGMVGVVP
jgi:hypothetical protein